MLLVAAYDEEPRIRTAAMSDLMARP